MNPFLTFVEGVRDGVEAARELEAPVGLQRAVEGDGCVLLFSPHPDDECITGMLPLRLMREAGRRIVNVPVTFGSDPDRQSGRAEELRAACGYLGWELCERAAGFAALEEAEIVRILEHYAPGVICVPHAHDWNPRHIQTHHLVVGALRAMGKRASCLVVETEFWGAMDTPNLAVEADAATVAELVAATSLHVGEVARNPYHLLLPAWMQDNVRRGAELVGGAGAEAPAFDFATLYRLRRWNGGGFEGVLSCGTMLAMGDAKMKEIF